MKQKAPLSAFEKGLADTVSVAVFPVGSGAKRFIRDIYSGYITQLTENGRWYLAFVAKRFRRQYRLTEEQLAWIDERLSHGDRHQAVPQGTPAQGLGSSAGEEALSEVGRGSEAQQQSSGATQGNLCFERA
jgi:hypothetical protein